ncbi:excinuclease ABC subunit UvrC [Marinilactibacillus psychrotolerans]|uniref:UvrABC system protein C n=2 Tax=Marinilactibacillus psychrotolerans TaxID=191770 RepID=A0A5R9C5T3_9LACT|nr:excinuclease ABC subunit UvrC [Marinilactibacillus psychrotolerans]TLQ08377.1 excinuclease ABC subunit UvrC [Marinilactibacillus psychrotolerans]GEQ32507.1 excinuclease ABC subunit C [Marinilactibacillus psychrotolerans]SJN41485.1 Excinuclease ABC subunit C [Marinilactibacillus psychrotolerans 42ea]
MSIELIDNKLSLLPDLPGCYIMKDKNDQIIYIGKAKNLKNRVRSYFRGTHDGKTARLVQDIRNFETIVTGSDKEALLLEVTLIQKHQPKYNIRLKRGTSYPYLKITNEKDPKLIITSEVVKDGAQYFGPYPDVYAASETQQLIQKIYPLRKCNGYQKRACLYYHIGQCIGPCDHEVPKEEYDKQIRKIRSFLNGNVHDIKRDLKQKMDEAAKEMNYESAAEFRDQIAYIEKTVEKQSIISNSFMPRDFFNFYMDKGWISIQVFFVRQATLIKRDATMFPCYDPPEEELMSFILQYYNNENNILPSEIYVPETVDKEVLAEAVEAKVINPKMGRKKELLDLTGKNSELALKEKFRLIEMNQRKTTGAIQELSQAMGLPYIERIESFDHSNIQGTNPVSAMISFKDGKPDKNNYRKYKIKTVVGSNEAATTQEVIRRRYSRLLKEGKLLPDLILMDGGKVQVNAAVDVLTNELSLDIPVAGMVKDNKHRTASLIFGENLEIVVLDPRSQAFHLVQRIQEEVHRFAITFHRNVRSKNSFTSKLDEVEGVGPKTKTKVLRHFKSMKRLKDADIEEIKKLGISETVAIRIKETLAEYQSN